MSDPRTRSRDEQGASALEFGLVAPLLLVLIFGIIQYGYLFWSLETASAAAREAARRLVVGTDWTCTKQIAIDAVADPAIDDSTRTATYRYTDNSGSTVSAANVRVGNLVIVTVSFQSLNMGLLPMPNNGIVSQDAQARMENIPKTALAC